MRGPLAPRNKLFLPRGYRKSPRLLVDSSDPINRNVVARWLLGEVLNGDSFDSSGQCPPATVQAGPLAFASSHHGGQAVTLNGSTQYFICTDNNLQPSTFATPAPVGTWAVWIKTNTVNGGYPILLAKSASNSNAGINLFLDTTTGAAEINVYNQTHTLISNITGGANLTDNVWHFVCLVWTQGTSDGPFILYVDGAQVASGSGAATWGFNNPSNLQIGKSTDAFWKPFLGSMEGVSLWNRRLSDVEIKRLYAEPYAGLYPANSNIVGIYVSASVSLTGVSATTAIGTLTTSYTGSVSLMGTQATAAVGSLGRMVTSNVALSGVQAASAAGIFGVGQSRTIALAGVQGDSAAGTFGKTVSSTVTLAGVSAAAQPGSFSAGLVILNVPMITIMNANPIPATANMNATPVPNEGDMPSQLPLETVMNTTPIPMTGFLYADPVANEGSVP